MAISTQVTAGGANARTLALLQNASFEIVGSHLPRELAQAGLPAGVDVFIPYLPTTKVSDLIDAAAAVRRAGFNPIPHVAARNLRDEADLYALAAGLVRTAAVTRVLVIAGDLAAPRGGFADSLAVLKAGVLQRLGIRSVGLAGHPEGSPIASVDEALAGLTHKLAFCRGNGIDPWVVTQFCFEAAPIVAFVERLRQRAPACPVRIGIAGRASPAKLLTFALRCGIGASLRALQKQGVGRVGHLIGDGSPGFLLRELGAAFGGGDYGVDGIHLFSFGATRETAAWVGAQIAELEPAA
jgi:methylenetetrahydrofolate reductase (NADPH)